MTDQNYSYWPTHKSWGIGYKVVGPIVFEPKVIRATEIVTEWENVPSFEGGHVAATITEDGTVSVRVRRPRHGLLPEFTLERPTAPELDALIRTLQQVRDEMEAR